MTHTHAHSVTVVVENRNLGRSEAPPLNLNDDIVAVHGARII